jgi:endonuclease III
MPAKRAKVARVKVFRGKSLEMHVREVVRRLKKAYPDAHTELDFTTPWQLLVATILSAQSTDRTVNLVTPALFARYATPADLAVANPEEVETIIKSTGFFRNKTKSIIGAAKGVSDSYGGAVPSTMDELVGLPGVGRKTANVVLGNAFDKNEGIVVDTHVTRLSKRLGFTANTDAVKIEEDLMPVVPRRDWTIFSHLLIFHGRRVCFARKPNCAGCVLADICPSAFRV